MSTTAADNSNRGGAVETARYAPPGFHSCCRARAVALLVAAPTSFAAVKKKTGPKPRSRGSPDAHQRRREAHHRRTQLQEQAQRQHGCFRASNGRPRSPSLFARAAVAWWCGFRPRFHACLPGQRQQPAPNAPQAACARGQVLQLHPAAFVSVVTGASEGPGGRHPKVARTTPTTTTTFSPTISNWLSVLIPAADTDGDQDRRLGVLSARI